MLGRIKNLEVTQLDDTRFQLTTKIRSDGQDITLSSIVAQPWLQINTTEGRTLLEPPHFFKHIILNHSASFHFNADALINPKDNSLFTLEMGKKKKNYIPKKHRKRDKKSSKR